MLFPSSLLAVLATLLPFIVADDYILGLQTGTTVTTITAALKAAGATVKSSTSSETGLVFVSADPGFVTKAKALKGVAYASRDVTVANSPVTAVEYEEIDVWTQLPRQPPRLSLSSALCSGTWKL